MEYILRMRRNLKMNDMNKNLNYLTLLEIIDYHRYYGIDNESRDIISIRANLNFILTYLSQDSIPIEYIKELVDKLETTKGDING